MSSTIIAAVRRQSFVRPNPVEPVVDHNVIHLEARRIDAGTGVTAVNGGIPMQQGQLMPADIENVALTTGNDDHEVACYVEQRGALYDDGSVMTLLLQFDMTTTYEGQMVDFRLNLDASPAEARITKRTVESPTGTTETNWPDATIANMAGVVFPTSTEQFCNWGGWSHGRLRPRAELRNLTGFDAWWETYVSADEFFYPLTHDGTADPANNALVGAFQYDRFYSYLQMMAMNVAPKRRTNDWYKKSLQSLMRSVDGLWRNDDWDGYWHPQTAAGQQIHAFTMGYLLFGMDEFLTGGLRAYSNSSVVNKSSIWYTGGMVGAAESRFGGRWLRAMAALHKCGVGSDPVYDPTWTIDEWAWELLDGAMNGDVMVTTPGDERVREALQGESEVFYSTQWFMQAAMWMDPVIAMLELGLVPAPNVAAVKTLLFAMAERMWEAWLSWPELDDAYAFQWASHNWEVETSPGSGVWVTTTHAETNVYGLHGMFPHVYAWCAREAAPEDRATWVARAEEILSRFPPIPHDTLTSSGKTWNENYHVSIYAWMYLKDVEEAA